MCTIKTLGGLLFYPKNSEKEVISFLVSKGMFEIGSSEKLIKSMQFQIIK